MNVRLSLMMIENLAQDSGVRWVADTENQRNL